jgi:hypothetical protein
MDGKMARARRWSNEKFLHNRVSTRIGEERMRGRVLFIPQEAKREALHVRQVSMQEEEHTSQ